MPRPLRALLAGVLLGAATTALPAMAEDVLEPVGTGGLAAVDRALARLSTHRRLLMVAAHPDDEDTSLLALVARGLGGEAAYLSLSRGEGGQNLLGPELGVDLGLLRSRELLAARHIDGAHQFFARAFDFGYSRSLEETLERWPREVLAEDVARVIRRFRPQVVVSVFPGVPSPTHGQHQAAGVVTHEVFETVGQAAAFPRLDAQGLPPFSPQTLYRSSFFDPQAATLTLPTGILDPVSGRSLFQLAMASRSQHRSQDMGALQPVGSTATRLAWVAGGAGAEGTDLFAGVDTRLPALAATLPAGAPRQAVEAHLARVEETARTARRQLSTADPATAVEPLAAVYGELEAALARVRGLADGGGPHAAEAHIVAALVEEKLAVARDGLRAAAGLAVDAVAEAEELVPGEPVAVRVSVWNGGGLPLSLTDVDLALPEGWAAVLQEGGDDGGDGFSRRFSPVVTVGRRGPLAPGDLAEARFEVTVAGDAPPTVPYFLARPVQGALYDWSQAPPELRGLPFDPPFLRARVTVRIADRQVTLEREVVHRYRDQAEGEVRRPLRVVPPLEVAVAPELAIWPLHRDRPHRLQVTLARHGRQPLTGRLRVQVPAGWPAPEPAPFTLSGEAATVAIDLHPPPHLTPGRYPLAVTAELADGRRLDLAVPLLDYGHIRPTPRPAPAVVEVAALDLTLPALRRVGYVRGASDRVPEVLLEVGLPLELLGGERLRGGDLAGFDAIIVGSRAYETDPDLRTANGRLLDYVRQGGLLLVQYQQYPFVQGGFPPYPLTISRPHDRVTDETVPVTLLDPAHPVFHRPNRLGPTDWQGWVQERGLYFAGTWDGAYRPLVRMADPGGPELDGGLLVAPAGAGTYVYTGLAFFRQLPAGVPGAFRLFANLLALTPGQEEPAR
jgi:LmbE family N-acetylglucosaminyl deacetylase